MIIIGITGSIGMGKTTVSKMLKILKIPVFDSDKKVKEIFRRLNTPDHTIEMMKAYYTKAMKYLDAVNADNKKLLILLSEKLMERIS